MGEFKWVGTRNGKEVVLIDGVETVVDSLDALKAEPSEPFVTILESEYNDLKARAEGKPLDVKVDSSALQVEIDKVKAEFEDSLAGKVLVEETEYEAITAEVERLKNIEAEFEESKAKAKADEEASKTNKPSK